ncbi:MAG: sugar transferase [bacterium]|nr:sugar transferase [bacterium]
MFRKVTELKRLAICLCDMICVCLSWLIVICLPFNDLSSNSLVVLTLVHIAVFYLSNVSKHLFRRGYLEEMKAVFIYNLQFMFAILVFMFYTGTAFNISRRGMVYFLLINMGLVYAAHIVLKMFGKRIYPRLQHSKKVYLVTTRHRVEKVLQRMEESGAWGGSVTAIALYDDKDRTIKEVHGIPVVANKEDYLTYPCYKPVDEVFINLPSQYRLNMEMVVSQLELMGVPVSINFNAFEMDFDCEKKVNNLAGFSVLTFSSNCYSLSSIVMKRCIDIVGALFGLLITGLVGIILVPLIKIESKGPAIFAQKRVGKNGRVFKFYKFRSMYQDAEARKAELMAQNEMNGLMFKMENDPRITKVGRFIRKTSLDELPQFYNVLIGDMSLVGTRPPTVDEFLHYEAYQKRRLSAKPGITGMWQVSGRSNIKDFNEVVKLDLKYIDNWSLWLDFKILFKTVGVCLFGFGAS